MPDCETPLCHCTLDDIAEELDKRFTAWIWAYVAAEKGDVHEAVDWWQGRWHGGKLRALGLAEAQAATLRNELAAQVVSTDAPEDDEDA